MTKFCHHNQNIRDENSELDIDVPKCDLCNDTGIITDGEFDDIIEKKCICQKKDYDEDDDS